MIIGKYARLRRVELPDAEYIRQLRNSPAVGENFVYRHFLTEGQQKRWVEAVSSGNADLYFVAERIDSGERFGVYHLKGIDHRNQHGELGFFLDEQARGRGELAFEAACLILDYGFNYLNLNKVFGEVLPHNTRAIRFDEGLGMHLEATRKKHVFYDGRFHDVLLYALFRDDFYERPTKFVKSFLANRCGRCESE